MSAPAIVLSDIERACGVTVDAVRATRARALIFADGTKVALDANTPPALAGAAARLAFGAPVRFAGLNPFGMPIYERAA